MPSGLVGAVKDAMGLLDPAFSETEHAVGIVALLHADHQAILSAAAARCGLGAVVFCESSDTVLERVLNLRSGILVVSEERVPDAYLLQQVRQSPVAGLRMLWIRQSAAPPPWESIDEVVGTPLDPEELYLRLRSLIDAVNGQEALSGAGAFASRTAGPRSAELERLVQDLQIAEAQAKSAHLDCIFRLALAAEYKDDDTAGHLHRMSQYSLLVGREMGANESQEFVLTYASMMHDVGKISIPDAILMKRGRLNREEWRIMQTHAGAGEKIMAGAGNPLMEAAAQIAGGHHEKWNGTGYPRGLRGEEIPLYARIVAVADVFDALTSERCYKGAISNEESRAFIETQRGKHFDPDVLDAFMARTGAIDDIQRQTALTNATMANLSQKLAPPVMQELGLPGVGLAP